MCLFAKNQLKSFSNFFLEQKKWKENLYKFTVENFCYVLFIWVLSNTEKYNFTDCTIPDLVSK